MDSPVIVSEEDGEFYKQPMFYALGHVTRFVDVGSTVVSVDADRDVGGWLTFSAAERPDGGVAVVVLNRSDNATEFLSVVDESTSAHFDVDVLPSSMHTFVYWK